MKGNKKSKKFVAFLDGNGYEDGESGFYLVDVDSWKKERCVVDEDVYAHEVYDSIEELREGCSLVAENYFTVEKRIETTEQLQEFLKPLPWILAIDENDYDIDESKIADFTPYSPKEKPENKILKTLEEYQGKYIIDDVICQFEKGKLNKKYEEAYSDSYYNGLMEYADLKNFSRKEFSYSDVQACKAWLKEKEAAGKVIFAVPDDNYKQNGAHLVAFDSVEDIENFKNGNAAYQFLKDVLEGGGKGKNPKDYKSKTKLQTIQEFAREYKGRFAIDHTLEIASTMSKEESHINLIKTAMMDIATVAHEQGANSTQYGPFLISNINLWMGRELDKNRAIYILPRGEEYGLLLSFDSMATIDKMRADSKAYQDLKNLVEGQKNSSVSDEDSEELE